MTRLMLVLFLVVLTSASVFTLPLLSSKSKNEKNSVEQDVSDSKITEEEKQFIKEIEEKFNIKNEDDIDEDSIDMKENNGELDLNVPFPAVIAIEIVNDTAADGKGKRTIDANLGYGYKTTNGYFYSQFGRKNSETGKFMIYPYSQHDILPLQSHGTGRGTNYHTRAVFTNRIKGEKTLVEIQPSKAYQLVPIDTEPQNEEQNSYSPNAVVSHLRTPYENVQTVETPPPPPQYSSAEDIYQHSEGDSPKILYSTYNGGHLSGFSGRFPSVMSNYYVSPSKILGHSQYQSFGLHNQEDDRFNQKRIIPVIILRIPSSQLHTPVAELYPKLPHSNPYATDLNHVNLQALVSQYLANFQAQFVAPQQQVSYVQPKHQDYSEPTGLGRLQYTVTQPSAHYIQPSQASYEQGQYIQDQPKQSYQYVQEQPQSYVPASHNYQQVYSTVSSNQVTGYGSQDDSQHLPISENYPGSDHTQVILNSGYQGSKTEQNSDKGVHRQAAEYSTPSPVTNYLVRTNAYKYFMHPRPSVQIIHQGSSYPEQTSASPQPEEERHEVSQDQPAAVEENAEAKYDTEAPSDESSEPVYNYHAHPYPKRQIKTTDKEMKKVSNRNRRIRSRLDTN